jgi:NitT/TauT family transport system ATP-binding protein
MRSHDLDAAEAERVLRTVIEWGRRGAVFEYDFHAGGIHLPEDEQEAPGGELRRRACPRFVTAR